MAASSATVPESTGAGGIGGQAPSVQAGPAPDSAPVAAGRGWGVPLLVLIIGMFMSVLDTSIVNVAIPRMQNEFGVTTDRIQWVANAYTLTLGVIVPASSWLSDRLGLKRLYILSLVGFTVTSALCGLAGDLNTMVAFRILQAIAGGILPVATLTMLYAIVPREKIGTAMGLYGLGVVVAPGVGPTLGGYLVEYVNWRLIFYINVPIGILGTLAAMAVLPAFPGRHAGRFDVLGFLTAATGLSALLLALTEGEDWGWGSYPILGLLTLGTLSLALFVVIELEVDHPLLDVRVFRYWPFTNSLLLITVLSIGLFAGLFYIPLLLQQALGLGAFEAGVTLLPQAIALAVLMPIAGRLYDHIGPRWPATVGVGIVTVGTYWLHQITLDTTREHIMWLLAFRAAGIGLAMMPVMTGGIASVPADQVGQASAFNNVIQRTSAAMGVAVLTALLTAHQAQLLADRSALVAAGTPTPSLGQPGTPPLAGMFAAYQQTQLQVFVTALDQLFVYITALTAVGVVLALLLRSGTGRVISDEGSDSAAIMH